MCGLGVGWGVNSRKIFPRSCNWACTLKNPCCGGWQISWGRLLLNNLLGTSTSNDRTTFCSARGSKLCPPDQESGTLTKGLASWNCLGFGRLLYRAVSSMLLLLHAVSSQKFCLLWLHVRESANDVPSCEIYAARCRESSSSGKTYHVEVTSV